MIRIHPFLDEEGRLTGFSCKGHAGYAEEGADIVCAAVSSLSIACVNALESVAEVIPQVMEDDESGLLTVHLPGRLTDAQTHDAQVLLRGFVQGLRDVAETYPAYVQFTGSI